MSQTTTTTTATPLTPGQTKSDIINTWGRVVVSVIVLLAFFVMIAIVMTRTVASSETTTLAVGSLITMAGGVVSYWIGSSAGSSAKDATIASAKSIPVAADHHNDDRDHAMNRLPILLALSLGACTAPLTTAQTTAGQTAVGVAGALVPQASQVIADGQLVCSVAGALTTIIDASTGKPFLVTGKAATTVANVCSLLGATPVAQPTGTAPTPVAVAIPAALKA